MFSMIRSRRDGWVEGTYRSAVVLMVDGMGALSLIGRIKFPVVVKGGRTDALAESQT